MTARTWRRRSHSSSGVSSRRVQAAPADRTGLPQVGCLFSPTDLLNFGAPFQNIVDFMRRLAGSVAPSFQFYDTGTKTGLRRPLTAETDIIRALRDYSPVRHVTRGAPPTILIHGDQDKAVPVQQSRQLMARLSDNAVPAKLVEREGGGSTPICNGWWPDEAIPRTPLNRASWQMHCGRSDARR